MVCVPYMNPLVVPLNKQKQILKKKKKSKKDVKS